MGLQFTPSGDPPRNLLLGVGRVSETTIEETRSAGVVTPRSVATVAPSRYPPAAKLQRRGLDASHTLGRTPDILQNLLLDLRVTPSRPGESESACVRHWLRTSSAGSQLVEYLLEEADLLFAAADRLTAAADEDLRTMGMELGRSARRLRRLASQTE